MRFNERTIMKKVILVAIVMLAMVGISNAQNVILCSGTPAPPGGCGYYDSDGFWVFTRCLYVNCSSDPLNCGSVGHICDINEECNNGECQEPPELCCATAEMLLKRFEVLRPRSWRHIT